MNHLSRENLTCAKNSLDNPEFYGKFISNRQGAKHGGGLSFIAVPAAIKLSEISEAMNGEIESQSCTG